MAKIKDKLGMKDFKAVSDFIIVKQIKSKNNPEKIGKIFIVSDTEREKDYIEAEIVDIGPGAFQNGVRVPIELKVGDNIIFSHNTAKVRLQEIATDDDVITVFCLKHYECMATLKNT